MFSVLASQFLIEYGLGHFGTFSVFIYHSYTVKLIKHIFLMLRTSTVHFCLYKAYTILVYGLPTCTSNHLGGQGSFSS